MARRGHRRAGWVVSAACLALTVLAPPAATASAAAPVESPAAWRQVSAGGFHTCAIGVSGRLFCWGHNYAGQLGSGAGRARDVPVEVAGDHDDWTSVAVGFDHTCAVRDAGHLFCWGSDVNGAVGDGPATGGHVTPFEVAGAHADWSAVSAGTEYTCGLRDGDLYCWGRDFESQLGDPTQGNAASPVVVGADLAPWADVDAGFRHTCGRTVSGRLYCWGQDEYGQGGDGPGPTVHTTPVEVAGARTDWASLAVGKRHTCATTSDGHAYCWGDDDFRQRGDGAGAGPDVDAPVPVTGGATDWVEVTTGDFHTCGRHEDGSLSCWGADDRGRLGDGPPALDRGRPVPVAASRRWAAVDAGRAHTCAVTVFDRLFCWGSDQFGQLGDGSGHLPRYAPNRVP